MASYDVWLWPTAEFVDEDVLRRLLAGWRIDAGYTGNAIAHAAAAAGHVEVQVLPFPVWPVPAG